MGKSDRQGPMSVVSDDLFLERIRRFTDVPCFVSMRVSNEELRNVILTLFKKFLLK